MEKIKLLKKIAKARGKPTKIITLRFQNIFLKYHKKVIANKKEAVSKTIPQTCFTHNRTNPSCLFVLFVNIHSLCHYPIDKRRSKRKQKF